MIQFFGRHIYISYRFLIIFRVKMRLLLGFVLVPMVMASFQVNTLKRNEKTKKLIKYYIFIPFFVLFSRKIMLK